jgi:hypothetical protein
MADLFGIRLVAATIARMSRTCAGRLQVRADHAVLALTICAVGCAMEYDFGGLPSADLPRTCCHCVASLRALHPLPEPSN